MVIRRKGGEKNHNPQGLVALSKTGGKRKRELIVFTEPSGGDT